GDGKSNRQLPAFSTQQMVFFNQSERRFPISTLLRAAMLIVLASLLGACGSMGVAIVSVARRGLRSVFDGVCWSGWLALIALGRSAGFSHEEIARMFAPNGGPKIGRRMLADKAQELDQTIPMLSAMHDGLKTRCS